MPISPILKQTYRKTHYNSNYCGMRCALCFVMGMLLNQISHHNFILFNILERLQKEEQF